jgi:hypothetical protein
LTTCENTGEVLPTKVPPPYVPVAVAEYFAVTLFGVAVAVAPVAAMPAVLFRVNVVAVEEA